MEAEQPRDDLDTSSGSDLFPPRSREHSPTNLPVQLTSFIGRKDEIAEIARLLTETRLITLTGSGGCGKTRLALQVAAGEQHSFPDGAWWVDLGPLTEAHLVANTIANALGIKEVPLQGFEQRIQTSLRDKTLLLVLDNCEHLVDVCAQLVEALLRSCPSLKVTTTSREPLGVAGETAWRVPSMSLPEEDSYSAPADIARYDAVRLFLERAEKARPNFKVTEENAPHIVEICRRLDGIPLAIELAAARARLLDPQQIVEALADRFRLLSGSTRTAIARQQTLLGSVEWSYNLLSEAEARLLGRLAVFSGSFTLEAGEAVGSDEAISAPQVLDLLGSLVDKSLVQLDDRSSPTRYRLLETIRQYAAQKLIESNDAPSSRDRHLDFYVSVAETAREVFEGSGDFMGLLESLDLDHDNFRAALEWAVSAGPVKGMRIARSLWGYWYSRGYLSEGSMRGETAGHASDEDPGWRARALATASVLATTNVDTVRARTLAEEALALARDGDDEIVLLEALYACASAHFLTNPARSHDNGSEALALARALGNDFYEMRATYILGLAECTAGNFSASERLLNETLRLHEEANNRVGLHVTLYWGAQTAHELGQLDDAEEFGAKGVSAAREVQNVQMECTCLGVLAGAATQRADFETAAKLLDMVRALSATHPNPVIVAQLPYWTALLNYARGELGGDARSLDDSSTFYTIGGMTWLAAWVYALQAEFSRAAGDLDAARERVGRALESARDSGNPCSIGRALRADGNLAHAIGDLDTAEDRLHEALRFLVQAGCKIDSLGVLERLAEIAAKRESWEESARLLSATGRLRDSLGYMRFVPDIPDYEESLEAVRAHLDPEALEHAWTEGEAMTLDETVAYVARGRGERKRPSSGWKSLTPVETDVVRLVAEGLTNPEIGKRLFISPGTVKNHLSHVFAKLGISTRSELAAEATRREASER
jgi:predicted ATPase/DNA-binding CsgD family transcriptional regulator